MLLEKLQDTNKKTYLNFELCLANSDGNMSDVEKRLIDAHCLEMGIDNNGYKPNKPVDNVIEDIKANFSENEKRIAYLELVSLACVDEDYDDEERKFIKHTQEVFGLSDETADEAEQIVTNLLKYTKMLEKFAGVA